MPIDDTSQDKPKYLCVDEYWEETLKQINRAHINMALESGELEPIIDSLVDDE